MKRAILFRFHTLPEVCRDRVILLRRHNPGVPVFGLYGGPPEQRNEFRAVLAACDHCLPLDGMTAWQMWTGGDLAALYWFRRYGTNTAFEMLHVVEWDLLLLAGVAEVFGHVNSDAVGITAPRPVTSVEGTWDWFTDDAYRRQWTELLEWARRNFAYRGEPLCCLGPGWCFPRTFLDACTGLAVPELCHDELRVPLIAQVLGFPLADTRICRAWMSRAEHEFFNCSDIEVQPGTILRELDDPCGRRAFHPYRKSWT
jgi:hypothetical protein